MYGNNVVPVFTYNTVLEPFQNYATIGNNQNNWLLYLGNTWSTNATLGYVDEGVGTSVVWNNMNWFSQSYSYDPLKRLTYALDYYSGSVGWGRNYAYDEYGNASVSVNLGVPLNGLTPVKTGNNWFNNPYSPANKQLLAESYDAAGNTTNVGSLQITYDAEAMQTQTYDSISHLQANYTYDANGQRVQKIFNGVTTLYVHDALGTLAAEYSTAAASTPACTTCYLSYDHLGSVRLITDQNASIVSRHDFQPFGEEIFAGTAGRSSPFGNATGVHQQFTDQERDQENTPPLDYFNARYFMGVLGSFTSPDPANAGADPTNPQSWNAYAYVRGNPLNGVDPSGLNLLSVIGDFFAGLFGGGGGGGGQVCESFSGGDNCGGRIGRQRRSCYRCCRRRILRWSVWATYRRPSERRR